MIGPPWHRQQVESARAVSALICELFSFQGAPTLRLKKRGRSAWTALSTELRRIRRSIASNLYNLWMTGAEA